MSNNEKLEAAFLLCTKSVNNLKTRPTDEDLLFLYGHYKQATEGNCNKSKPLFINFKECAKWDAWNKLMNLPKEEAMLLYIKKVKELFNSNN